MLQQPKNSKRVSIISINISLTPFIRTSVEVYSKNTNYSSPSCLQLKSCRVQAWWMKQNGDTCSQALLEKSRFLTIRPRFALKTSGQTCTDKSMVWACLKIFRASNLTLCIIPKTFEPISTTLTLMSILYLLNGNKNSINSKKLLF